VDNIQQEIEHMNGEHPDIVIKRLRAAGFHREADEFEVERGI
jgi:hypothetical protein